MKDGSPIYEWGDSSLRWLRIRLDEMKEAIVSVPVDLPEINEQSFIEATLSTIFLIPSSLLDVRRSDKGVFEARVKLSIGVATIDSWIEGTIQDVNTSLSQCGDGASTQCFGYSPAEAVAYSNEDSIRVCDVVLNHTTFVPLTVGMIMSFSFRHNPSPFTMYSHTPQQSSMLLTVHRFIPSSRLSLYSRIISFTCRAMPLMITMK